MRHTNYAIIDHDKPYKRSCKGRIFTSQIMPKGQTTFKTLTKTKLETFLEQGLSLAEIGRKYNSTSSAVLKKIKREKINYTPKKVLRIKHSLTLANELLRNYKITTFPINLDPILNDCSLSFNESTSINHYGTLTANTITLNHSLSNAEKRFTLAYLLGARLLHKQQDFSCHGYSIDPNLRDKHDIQECITFAEHLLLPTTFLNKEIKNETTISDKLITDIAEKAITPAMIVVHRLENVQK